MVCSDCKKYSGYVTERDDGNARRQFVPTNCACSPGLGSPREGAVITSVLIGQNHRISTTENIDNMHIIANWTSLGGKVYDTTFVGNRAARVVEKLSREYGLIIANEVRSA